MADESVEPEVEEEHSEELTEDLTEGAFNTPAQYYSVFANWVPNTGSNWNPISGTVPNVPKLAITNPNNLPNFNPYPTQVHQHTTSFKVGF